MSEEIINRVANSGLITFDLEAYYNPGERASIDLKELLFKGLILREKDLRDFADSEDWTKYQGKLVTVFCSTDAVIPTWAYMLIGTKLQPFANRIFYGNPEMMEQQLYHEVLSQINIEDFRDARVVVKGCGNLPVPVGAYLEITRILTPVVKSLMFGEPCSTVPIFKRKA